MSITLPALSVQQPWAYSILYLDKRVENRSWRLPSAYIDVPILLHASKTINTDAFDFFDLKEIEVDKSKLITGGIIGVIKFNSTPVDQNNLWAMEGVNHWSIANAIKVPFHSCRGYVGFFKVSYPSNLFKINKF